MAPSTLGTFLRAFTFGHVRQLDRVLASALKRAWQADAGPGDARATAAAVARAEQHRVLRRDDLVHRYPDVLRSGRTAAVLGDAAAGSAWSSTRGSCWSTSRSAGSGG
ncbi:MAG: hypothetical protein ABIZ91_20125 [Gemmatimonadaceae bacterium]